MSWWMIVGITCAIHLAVPRDAFALFEWLDHLSGPGPFRGDEFYARLFCVMDRPSPQEVKAAADKLNELLTSIESARFTDSQTKTIQTFQSQIQAFGASANIRQWLFDTSKATSQLRETVSEATLNPRTPPPPPQQPSPDLTELRTQLSALLDQQALLLSRQLSAAKEAADDIARQGTIPRVRRAPGMMMWADCRDKPNKREGAIDRRGDRHPVFSLSVHYRRYSTGSPYWFELPFLSKRHDKSSSDWADGQNVTLKTYTVQGSWPLTGRLDILDGSAAIGIYQFASEGFRSESFPDNKTRFFGLLFEPVRMDLHVPAQLFDDTKNPFLKVLYSTSLRWGLTTFPGGIDGSKFNPSGSAIGKDVSEVVFDWGIGWNVGRLIKSFRRDPP